MTRNEVIKRFGSFAFIEGGVTLDSESKNLLDYVGADNSIVITDIYNRQDSILKVIENKPRTVVIQTTFLESGIIESLIGRVTSKYIPNNLWVIIECKKIQAIAKRLGMSVYMPYVESGEFMLQEL